MCLSDLPPAKLDLRRGIHKATNGEGWRTLQRATFPKYAAIDFKAFPKGFHTAFKLKLFFWRKVFGERGGCTMLPTGIFTNKGLITIVETRNELDEISNYWTREGYRLYFFSCRQTTLLHHMNNLISKGFSFKQARREVFGFWVEPWFKVFLWTAIWVGMSSVLAGLFYQISESDFLFDIWKR